LNTVIVVVVVVVVVVAAAAAAAVSPESLPDGKEEQTDRHRQQVTRYA